MIWGDRIYLSTSKAYHGGALYKWRTSPEMQTCFFNDAPFSVDEHDRWLQSFDDCSTKKLFIIHLKEDRQPIGTIGLKEIDLINRTALFSWFMIEPSYQGQGYGREALNLLLYKYAFGTLNLNKILLYTLPRNKAAIHLYGGVGFRQEGVLRKQLFKEGAYHDLLVFGLLANEYLP